MRGQEKMDLVKDRKKVTRRKSIYVESKKTKTMAPVMVILVVIVTMWHNAMMTDLVATG